MLLGNIDSKLPENYFMKWFRERMKEGRINLRFKASGERYLSDFIQEEDINEWRPEMPVFISAQTGAGKNWFIQQILMYNLSESNHENGTNKKILLLSNRVAANRQAKHQLMELLPDYEANNTMRPKTIYSTEGLDEALKQLHNVYIYSYKQFLSAENLGQRNFKYVVCDECHYFTSDAPFAPETQQVLQKVIHECSGAIRIYMSATPDVAFEPILRTEYVRVQQVIDALNEAREERLSIVANANIDQLNTAIRGTKTVEDFAQFYQAQKGAEREEVNLAYDKEIASEHLDVLFYYMERNFDYIQNLFFYQNEEELTARLLQSLKNSEEKWLIFARTKKDGRALCKKINDEFSKAYPDDSKEKNSVPIAIFIDADSRKTDGMEAEEFQYIVENESFRPSVLIATSTLDNGVNIKDENVKNVVIDFFDRTEFLQMLGRVRIDPNSEEMQTINLYVKEYMDEELKKMLSDCISDMLGILRLDTLEPDQKYLEYNNQIEESPNYRRPSWRINPATHEIEYNENAVCYYISHASCILSYLKEKNANYFFSFDKSKGTLRALRTGIYNFYCYKEDGKHKPWSRSIVDIIEIERNARRRSKEATRDMYRGIENRYGYTLNDTFTHHIYATALPEFYEEKIREAIDKTKELIAPKAPPKKRHIDSGRSGNEIYVKYVEKDLTPFDKGMSTRRMNEYISSFEELCYLRDYLREQHLPTIDVSEYELLDKKRIHYLEYAAYTGLKSSMEVQAHWLERTDLNPQKTSREEAASEPSSDDIEKEKAEFYESVLKYCIVPRKEMEQHKHKKKDGTVSDNKYDKEYLETHGIKKGSKKHEKFERLYDVKINMNSKGQTITINEAKKDCYFGSYLHPTGNETYYVLHPVETAESQSE